MQVILQLHLRFMEKQASIRLSVTAPFIIRKHVLQRLLLLFKELLQRAQLIANISQLKQCRDIVSYLLLELAALELVALLHAAGIFARVFFVGGRTEAFGAEVFEGDGHLFDEDADGLFEDAEDFEVSVGRAFE